MRSLLVTMLLCAPNLVAQQPRTAGDVAEQKRLAQRALERNRAQVDRLVDMRLRHDLGLLPSLDDDVVRVETPKSTRDMDRMRSELAEIQAHNTVLSGEYDRVRRMVSELHAKARAGAGDGENGEFVPVPSAGSRLPIASEGGRDTISGSTSEVASVPAGPAVEMAPSKVRAEDLGPLALDPPRAQIHGSSDHYRVAQSLFKAGQALMDRANALRTQGRADVAKELDDRGRERLLRAVDELKPLLEQKRPPFVALFYLGRCRELLFRYSERHEGLSLETSSRDFQRREQEVRDPFLQISARDVKKSGESGEVETLGSWGQAAKTAMEHFRWMNINGRYDATSKIEALTWPGADQR
ncbi:MAG: hypothetical protein KAI24_16735 [Planctomycetes bacterium]|nr:hypothetical protein [Planctomycetota bacterium]